MVEKLKKKTKALVRSKHLLPGVLTASFLESTVVPIPIEAALLPLMQARRDKLWLIAAVAVLGCLIGALFGYALGYLAFDLLHNVIVEHYVTERELSEFMQRMRDEGFWFVLTAGIAPIPLQIAMLAAGATQFSLTLYLIAVAISRALRYFGIALLVQVAGDRAEKLIREHKVKTMLLSVVLIGLVWWLTR
ncbi:DedA family protein [Alteromonas sediminis]|uniref:DedA family protein n=1 Tax=Alteromonas sediminis TaxID=2259342 RepID=A0A3N5Y253_9ALTE|nr:VTT domain-containing protein [Alteromonas sediminis]RPJ66736.1 DedA family protein [Alteromonas sediminis]